MNIHEHLDQIGRSITHIHITSKASIVQVGIHAGFCHSSWCLFRNVILHLISFFKEFVFAQYFVYLMSRAIVSF